MILLKVGKPQVSNCAGVYHLEHNYIVRYIKNFYISDNIVVFKMVYPSTIAYLWLTNTMRMTHLEDDNAR